MSRIHSIVITCLLVLLLAFPAFPLSQKDAVDIEELKKTAPKVFIDCGRCDIDYIRTEITFVNYVRDRKEAQIHVLITTQRTGAGGREYTISFLGQLEFKGIDDTHKYFSEQTDTHDEIREGLTKALKIGLMSYVAKTPIASRIEISYDEKKESLDVKDKWNFWVFRISGSGRLRGEKLYKNRYLRMSLSTSRVTEELKINLSVYGSSRKSEYSYDSGSIDDIQETYSASGLVVKSLNDHWSVGAFFEASSSTYRNIQFSLTPQPAVEYNLFPYSESTRRQLRFLYRFGYNAVKYREETIYDKTSENLWNQSLSVTLSLKEKWGSISTTLGGSHYFHDFGKNRLTFFNIVNLRLFKGLNFFAFGGASRIHDQLFLEKGEAIFEEVLLRRRQLETSYDYFFSIGLSFTFGSIYTNVVNPRFGSGGMGGIHIYIE